MNNPAIIIEDIDFGKIELYNPDEVVADILSGHGSVPFLTFWGLTPKYGLLCGNCGMLFKTRFKITECEDRNPHAKCPHCFSINRVPLSWDDEEETMYLD